MKELNDYWIERRIRCDICKKPLVATHPRQVRHNGECAEIAKIRTERKRKGIIRYMRETIKRKQKR